MQQAIIEFLAFRNLYSIPYSVFWILLGVLFLVFLITLKIMTGQSKHFQFQRGIAITRFSIMDMEFPGSEHSISNIILGIHKLPEDLSRASMKALKGNLYTDFVFMAAVYPFIALLCYHTAELMQHFGRAVFLSLALLQLLAWGFDLVENYYLFHKIRKPYPAQPRRLKQYKNMVLWKWGIATTGLVTAIAAHAYFWVNGVFGTTFYTVGIVLLIVFAALILWMGYQANRAFFGKARV